MSGVLLHIHYEKNFHFVVTMTNDRSLTVTDECLTKDNCLTNDECLTTGTLTYHTRLVRVCFGLPSESPGRVFTGFCSGYTGLGDLLRLTLLTPHRPQCVPSRVTSVLDLIFDLFLIGWKQFFWNAVFMFLVRFWQFLFRWRHRFFWRGTFDRMNHIFQHYLYLPMWRTGLNLTLWASDRVSALSGRFVFVCIL